MKTLVILTEIPDERPKFAIVEGDLRELNGIYVNSANDDDSLQKKVYERFYPNDTLSKEFTTESPTKPFDFDFIIQCGFFL